VEREGEHANGEAGAGSSGFSRAPDRRLTTDSACNALREADLILIASGLAVQSGNPDMLIKPIAKALRQAQCPARYIATVIGPAWRERGLQRRGAPARDS